MFVICVANIVACLICIAATIVGCAYIVKRHSNRRMVLRRPHHTGSIARDSYISDIGGVIDPVFTPPLVPPPPYSPPEYTEISNDPIIIEGPDFLDDLSTPTPVLPVAPHEMPPPYSTINILPGTTIECSVAQEFQVTNEEVGNHFHFLSIFLLSQFWFLNKLSTFFFFHEW
ncbi:protein ENTREP2-like [Lytechinus pictus]|uniref:protein ENTREP2-like n=1 Tax=Lytechinus pictus TaxID=7653 RepID=UPI00240E0B18|nr:protein ENTREP2-like [Lytechinus pictus]